MIKDIRTTYVPVGCGRCIECLKQKKRGWMIRLQEDIKCNNNAKFITLTFNEDNLNKLEKETISNNSYIKQNEIATIATRRFLERWRKRYKKSIRHWLVTELGQTNTERIHLHGLIWTDESDETIKQIWQYGNIWIGTFVNNKTINYITKYIHKLDPLHKDFVPKVLCSKGIGSNYLKKNLHSMEKRNDYYRTSTGHKMALPTYYRNNVFSEDERELLWLKKMDENKHFIMGEEVKADDEQAIKELLEYYQKKNEQFGYGSDKKNWDVKEYENRVKIFKIKNKLKK